MGFHPEPRDPQENPAAPALLGAKGRQGRRARGPDAVAVAFIDDRHGWKRLSETWADPDLSDPDIAFELAARLTDYITTIEPLSS